ncbi:MAG: Uma2 family endonuclease [Opitutaceae bacterium]|nr:Uma2 family endonuclease [Opitutaceae bacterium]
MEPAHVRAEPLTVEDYRATPEGTRYQLVEGDLYLMSPAPNRFHQIIVLNIAEMLRGFLRNFPIGEVYISPIDVFLDDNNVVQPDVAFVSNARLPILKDDGIHGAPDLVVEVLSPSTAALEKTKLRVYARHGVKEHWLVDPTLRQIHVYEFAKHPTKAVRLIDEDESFTSECLPGLTIQAADFFRR